MDRYVHLCFAVDHPMAYRVRQRKEDAKLTYLEIDRSIVYEPGVMFTPGVGYARGVTPITVTEACEQNLIDFEVLYTRTNWRDSEIQERRRAAELCEILVPDKIPLTFVRNLRHG